ncbi:hypothetical protein GALMADRAFT_881372 [Galerina marginata CBS 339.88]|uniref:Uncharacterized protein n=1 Tax=Galerina marginata (strain CBS 339.88) TaxID=685588 RepID=A0A067SIB7_GALM3|nr:hypothetical protein GALMADRAFT_881372 [Galerina marginata CBS 339.88]
MFYSHALVLPRLSYGLLPRPGFWIFRYGCLGMENLFPSNFLWSVARSRSLGAFFPLPCSPLLVNFRCCRSSLLVLALSDLVFILRSCRRLASLFLHRQ